ncbi:MAG TPA: hypothetical protein DD381_09330 [Lentisphaeria bacterium]|nr:MAG: hypothetical protein A2X47_11495 [Lentisphaerae bacterium GWF2_38_69]HBM16525.1 hypothetical protein [Lentisphaeria bacterium]
MPGFDFGDEVIAEEKKEQISYERKKGVKKGSCTLELPDNMEVRETIHELPEEKLIDEATGEELLEIGRESINKLASSPVRYYT